MIIGVPKEIKTHEYRVGLVPGSVREIVHQGYAVLIEKNAGASIGFSDSIYKNAGAEIVETAQEVFSRADLIVKVKEPQPQEFGLLREGQVLITYLHLAADPEQTAHLVKAKVIAIGYETVTNNAGQLPLLIPSSEVAGRMSVPIAAKLLEKDSSGSGGSGVLLGGVPGVMPGHVVIIGGGIAGTAAARMAMGLGAHVTVIDRSLARLQELDYLYGARLNTLYSTAENIEHTITTADVVIGAVLVPGAVAPKLVTRTMLSKMKDGSVIVDLAIDQGGCFETSRPTTHGEPTYVIDNIIHYCVTNMPGALARTSAQALNNATLPFITALASKGYQRALLEDKHLLNGLNIFKGYVTYKAVAHDLGYDYIDPQSLL